MPVHGRSQDRARSVRPPERIHVPTKKSENGSDEQIETGSMTWLMRIWNWCTVQRVQAIGTAVIAFVTAWTLFFTPLGERLVSEINQTVRETKEELEHHRTVATKVTLRALWSVADDRLAENEYFARIAEDYRAHAQWSESYATRPRDIPDQKRSPSLPPSTQWLNPPPLEGRPALGVIPSGEKGRWGERSDEIMELWPSFLKPEQDRDQAHMELREKLNRWLNTHFRGEGYGAPRTGRALIEQLKSEEAVSELGPVGGETLRQTLDRFLRVHPDLASMTIRVQFDGPYSESQVIELGKEVVQNVDRFRDEFRAFIKLECGPYF